MNSFVSCKIRPSPESLCATVPTAWKRTHFLLIIRMFQIDELKNVHSRAEGGRGVSNAADPNQEKSVLGD
jgi:hypothetical protein